MQSHGDLAWAHAENAHTSTSAPPEGTICWRMTHKVRVTVCVQYASVSDGYLCQCCQDITVPLASET